MSGVQTERRRKLLRLHNNTQPILVTWCREFWLRTHRAPLSGPPRACAWSRRTRLATDLAACETLRSNGVFHRGPFPIPDALAVARSGSVASAATAGRRSEEHTSELQSPMYL